MLSSFFCNWTHNSLDICAYRCHQFCRLVKICPIEISTKIYICWCYFCSSVYFSKNLLYWKWKYDDIIYLTIYYSQYCTNISIEPMKATETAVFRKIPTGTPAVKFSVKLLPANMGFVNYSGLKFPQIFRTHRSRHCKKVFWEKIVLLNISQISQGNTYVGVSFWQSCSPLLKTVSNTGALLRNF